MLYIMGIPLSFTLSRFTLSHFTQRFILILFLMSSHSSTTPLVNTIADLTNAEHVKFVQAFQTKFDHFRATPNPNKKRGSQKSWVCQHVMGEFQMKFGPTSREMLDVRIPCPFLHPAWLTLLHRKWTDI